MKQTKKFTREGQKAEDLNSKSSSETSENTAKNEEVVETESEQMKMQLSELQEKHNQLNDNYLRIFAEFDNYRKRNLKEKADLIKNGGEKVLIDFISLVDDMERGLSATKDAKDVVAIKEGMELIYNKMQSFLKQNSVLAIETEGKAFDTDLHEAVSTFPAPSEDLKGKVVDCVQKGYTMNEKVIRFAKVVVGE